MSTACGVSSANTKPSAKTCSRIYEEYSEKHRFPVLPTYDQVLKCSHLFNLLDARGAISVTERVGVIKRVRDLAVGTAKLWADQQALQGPSRRPHERTQIPSRNRHRRNSALDDSWSAEQLGTSSNLFGATPQVDATAAPVGGPRVRACRSERRIEEQIIKGPPLIAGDKGRCGIRQESRASIFRR